jgi:hypothetical protein
MVEMMALISLHTVIKIPMLAQMTQAVKMKMEVPLLLHMVIQTLILDPMVLMNPMKMVIPIFYIWQSKF